METSTEFTKKVVISLPANLNDIYKNIVLLVCLTIFDIGNTIGYEDLQKYLDEQYPDLKVDVYKHFIPRIKDLILDTFLSIKDDLKACRRKSSFEFFGYDFLIDEDFRVSNLHTKILYRYG